MIKSRTWMYTLGFHDCGAKEQELLRLKMPEAGEEGTPARPSMSLLLWLVAKEPFFPCKNGQRVNQFTNPLLTGADGGREG